MKKILLLLMLLGSLQFALSQTDHRIGHPDRTVTSDIYALFKNPPKGYGEVPFYWWLGDTLTREHLSDHLDMLQGKSISSLQVNYAHSDKGGKAWGLTYRSQPDLFTEEWWELFGWFLKEAKKRGMTVSLSDYTLGVGQEKFVDEALAEHPEIEGAELRFTKLRFQRHVSYKLPHPAIALQAYPIGKDGEWASNEPTDLTNQVADNRLEWDAPYAGEWMLACIYAEPVSPSYDPMHPLSGSVYIRHFFQQFEDRFKDDFEGGVNFFFSDELNFNLKGLLWNGFFRNEFRRRKGYDNVPHLVALFEDAGRLTSKYRMDFNDVMVSLSEEHFFKPIYDWHEQRGLIYGCDHGGRGLDVTEFGDYFRTQRWNQAPGCDQPSLQHDIIKNKVASSIAHLYNRPRTWLEGFYGSGWDTSSAMLLDAIFSNFVQGQNLLSLHGLYYSTPGGWWEWAPPCNHFRMPYWEHMPYLLRCTERLSYLLSQGYHCADVAILYPVESVVAGHGDRSVRCAFELGRQIYDRGIDFDFMDYESLARATVRDGKLTVANEAYPVLVIPSMKAIRQASLEKALALRAAGGTVIFIDELPVETDHGTIGKGPLQDSLLQCSPVSLQKAVQKLATERTPDFRPATSKACVMHRRIGDKQLYAVYNVPKGSECFFRAKGAVELWNPWNGERKRLTATRQVADGTLVTMPLEATEIQLLLFTPDACSQLDPWPDYRVTDTMEVGGDWEITYLPTMDNKWGDYHWPASDGLVGPEIRRVRTTCQPQPGWQEPSYADDGWRWETNAFSSQFLYSGPLPRALPAHLLHSDSLHASWTEYAFSWRWGVEDDYGHQGYHGLKCEVHDDFIRLGQLVPNATGLVRRPHPMGNHHYLYTHVVAPHAGTFTWQAGSTLPRAVYVNGRPVDLHAHTVTLKRGSNSLLLHYDTACTTYFVVTEAGREDTYWPESIPERPLASRWNGLQRLLPYVTTPRVDTCYYRFTVAPGTVGLLFHAYADSVSLWADGRRVGCTRIGQRADGCSQYRANFNAAADGGPQLIAIQASAIRSGRRGGALFPYPIKQLCSKGRIRSGDWGEQKGLAYYSGGICYSNHFTLPALDAHKHYLLDLTDVVSSAEVWVNGLLVGVRMAAPWRFDITAYLKEGDNLLSIRVYNTAHNHYRSIPTLYNRSRPSGLLDKVLIHQCDAIMLQR